MKIRKVVLMANREILTFLIVAKRIFYTDRKLKLLVRCMPPPENMIRIIQQTRNRVPYTIVNLFNFSEKEKLEYDNATDDKELANIIIRDGKLKGCKLMGNVEIDIDKQMYEDILKSEFIQ